MAVLRDERFTYNATVVGDTTGGSTYVTEIGDWFAFRIDQDRCFFECRFVLRATGASDMAAKAPALEAALRQRYAKLTVTWGATTQETFDPAVNTSTGWDGEPLVEKDPNFPHSALARGYVFRCQVALPPNYTDAYGAAAGRRQIDVNLHYDVNERRVVTITGVWTQAAGSPGHLGRQQFLLQITAFAAYRLNIIDPAATWAVTRREESDPNSQSTLTFTRELSEHVNGRRISRVTINRLPSQLVELVIAGTYLRTITGANYGSAASSSANYADGATGGVAYAEGTEIPAVLNANGVALDVGTNCYRTSQTQTTNEQDDRTDYVLTYREVNFRQSSAANVLDDPDVILDTIVFESSWDPINDSQPVPSSTGPLGPVLDGSTAGLIGQGATPNGGASAGNNAGGGGGPPTPINLGNGPGGATGGQGVQKPVLLRIRYECTINKALKGEDQLRAKWETDLLPYLIEVLPAQLGVPPLTLVRQAPSFDAQNNRIAADVVAQGFPSDLIAFRLAESVETDWGIRLSRVYNGKAYAYVVQQGLPRQVKVRTLSAIYRAGGAFGGLAPLGTKTQIPGFVLLRVSQPDKVTSSVGVNAGNGNTLGLVSLTSEIMVETLEYVGSQVNQAVT